MGNSSGFGCVSLSSGNSVSVISNSKLAISTTNSTTLAGSVAVAGSEVTVSIKSAVTSVSPVTVSGLAGIELLGKILVTSVGPGSAIVVASEFVSRGSSGGIL